MSKLRVLRRRKREYELGDFDQRIKLHVRSITPGIYSDSGFTETYNDGVETWARIRTLDLTGKKYFDDVNVETEPTHEFVIRYRSWVTAEYVVGWRGDYYNIKRIRDPEERNDYSEILCRLVGDDDYEANT